MQEKREVWLKNNIQSVKTLEQKVCSTIFRFMLKNLDFPKYSPKESIARKVLFQSFKVKRKSTQNGYSPTKKRETLNCKNNLLTLTGSIKWFKKESQIPRQKSLILKNKFLKSDKKWKQHKPKCWFSHRKKSK